MSPVVAALVVLALVGGATALGLWWRRAQGRTRAVDGPRIAPAETGLDAWSAELTLVQLSTETCTPCRAAHRVLDALARTDPRVAHVDVDLAERPGLATRFDVRQTPTILAVDRGGAVRARIGGAPRPADVRRLVDELTASGTRETTP